jgi:hypothetical protein
MSIYRLIQKSRTGLQGRKLIYQDIYRNMAKLGSRPGYLSDLDDCWFGMSEKERMAEELMVRPGALMPFINEPLSESYTEKEADWYETEAEAL